MAKLFDVVTYFLKKSSENNTPITHLKLQKLCYYAQAWHLVLSKDKSPLFNGDFEAWVHGPVLPELFSEYKSYGWNYIYYNEEAYDLKKSEISLLDEVWEVYGGFDAKYLEAITHQELPWKEARKNIPDHASSNKIIQQKTMKSYYSSLLSQ